MSDTVVTGVRAERSGSAHQPASCFRRIGPMSALQAVMEEHGLDGGAIIEREGIPPAELGRAENFIRVRPVGSYWISKNLEVV